MNDSHRDLHEILGVARGATAGQIRRAYRSLALKCHPDRHPEDPTAEERFKELQWAYHNLSDGPKSHGMSGWRPHRRTAPPQGEEPHPFLGFFAALRAHLLKRSAGEEGGSKHDRVGG